MALLRKMTCDSRHPMGLRHPVQESSTEYHEESFAEYLDESSLTQKLFTEHILWMTLRRKSHTKVIHRTCSVNDSSKIFCDDSSWYSVNDSSSWRIMIQSRAKVIHRTLWSVMIKSESSLTQNLFTQHVLWMTLQRYSVMTLHDILWMTLWSVMIKSETKESSTEYLEEPSAEYLEESFTEHVLWITFVWDLIRRAIHRISRRIIESLESSESTTQRHEESWEDLTQNSTTQLLEESTTQLMEESSTECHQEPSTEYLDESWSSLTQKLFTEHCEQLW